MAFSDIDVPSVNDPNGIAIDTPKSIIAEGIALELKVEGWTKITKVFGDFSIAALTTDISLATLQAQSYLRQVYIKHSLAGSGGAVASLTTSVGIVGDLVKYFDPAFNVFQAAGPTVFDFQPNNEGVETFGGTTDIRVAMTSTVANLDQLTAGSFDYWIQTGVLP